MYVYIYILCNGGWETQFLFRRAIFNGQGCVSFRAGGIEQQHGIRANGMESTCISKKSPTGPAERTPKPENLIALATSLGVRWDSVPFNF